MQGKNGASGFSPSITESPLPPAAAYEHPDACAEGLERSWGSGVRSAQPGFAIDSLRHNGARLLLTTRSHYPLFREARRSFN